MPMPTLYLGGILIAVGVLAVIAGVSGGIAYMFRDLQRSALQARSPNALQFPTETINAFTELLRALTAAPIWLALVAVGFGLIIYGSTLIGG
ncbi:MAG TPA: hypothetical protein VER55_00855 [Ardenticatenaceae bacterium]|nr:hypothetical protein [Ardenticatenaceae bacterium]